MVARKTKGVIAIPAALVGFSAGSVYGATYKDVCLKTTKTQMESACCGGLWTKGSPALSAVNSCYSTYAEHKADCDLLKSSGLAICDDTKNYLEMAVAENKKIDDQYAKDLATCQAETPPRGAAECFYPSTGSCKDTESGPKCYLKLGYWNTDVWGGGNYNDYSSCVTYYNNDHTSCINSLGNCSTQEAALAAVDSALTSCLSSSGG
jgi:hypothetical protein